MALICFLNHPFSIYKTEGYLVPQFHFLKYFQKKKCNVTLSDGSDVFLRSFLQSFCHIDHLLRDDLIVIKSLRTSWYVGCNLSCTLSALALAANYPWYKLSQQQIAATANCPHIVFRKFDLNFLKRYFSK